MSSYRLPYLPHLRLRATFRAQEQARLPAFKGSMLRGVFGHSLRSVVCAMEARTRCEGCSLRGACVYTKIFETFVEGEPPPFLKGVSTSVRPFVFEPVTEVRDFSPGDVLETGLVLVGRAVELQPFVLLALERMGGRGFGSARARFSLERVDYLGADGRWRSGFRAGAAAWPGGVGPVTVNGEGDECERATVRFLTPTRVQTDGTVRREVRFRRLVFLMLRRVLELAHFHVPGAEVDWEFRPLLEASDRVRVVRSDLRWQGLRRYSNRQRGSVPLDGFVGEMELAGDLGPFMPLLRAAEVVHVGKGAAFGLGQVEVLAGG
jgi:hypothetical protein